MTTFAHPRKWIAFCGQCVPKINEAFAIQKKVDELEVRLNKFKVEVRDVISLTYVKNRKKLEAAEKDQRRLDPLRVTRETWRFIGKDVSSSSALPENRTTGRTHPLVNSGPSDSTPVIRGDSPTFASADCPDDFHSDDDNDHGYHQSHDPIEFEREEPVDNNQVENQRRVDNAKDSADKVIVLNTSKPELDTNWTPRFNDNGGLANNGYPCQLCPQLKPMKLESFVKHIVFHNDRQFRCSVCGTYFTGNETEISKCPKLLHKKEGVWDDHVCVKKLLVPVTSKPEVLLECGHCQSVFRSEEGRSVHEKDAHSQHLLSIIPLSYSCSICSRKFRDYVEWRLHRALEHPELAKLGCFYCDKVFTLTTKDGIDLVDAAGRSQHMLEYHKSAQKTEPLVDCDFCGENFGTDVLLREHVGMEHGQRSYLSCHICFSRKSERSHLKTHMQVIHGVKMPKENLICDICGYKTNRPSSFKHHKLMKHGEEREVGGQQVHSCSQKDCSFKYTRKSVLRFHMMRVHNAERCFKCETCGKGFLNSTHLKTHEDIHLNAKDRPFQCEICGNSFAVRNYLYIHMRLSHQNRPFASTNKKRRNVKKVAPSGKPVPPTSSALSNKDTEGNDETPLEITTEAPTSQHSDRNGEETIVSTAADPEV